MINNSNVASMCMALDYMGIDPVKLHLSESKGQKMKKYIIPFMRYERTKEDIDKYGFVCCSQCRDSLKESLVLITKRCAPLYNSGCSPAKNSLVFCSERCIRDFYEDEFGYGNTIELKEAKNWTFDGWNVTVHKNALPEMHYFKERKQRAIKYVVYSTLCTYLQFSKSGWHWVDDINLATQFDNKQYALQKGRQHMKWKAGVTVLKVVSKVEAIEDSNWG